jgi:SH3-like domain-containing protein
MQKIILIAFIIFFSLFKYVYADDEYRTLKNDKANLRQGPSFEYPVKIFYKKKFLPVLILDSSDNFKKIRDHENNSGWIHVSQLSKKKAAIVIDDDVIVFSKPSVFSTPLVILRKGRLCKIVKCKQDWCRIKVDKYKGWIKKDDLWGLL